MTTRKFSWRPGFQSGAVKAEDAAKEIERIRSIHGRANPPIVLEEATPPVAILHDAFGWDDAHEAHLRRLEQAARLLRAILVIRDDAPPRAALVRVGERAETDYQTMEIVVQHPDRYAEAVRLLQREASEALRSVQELRDVAKELGADEQRLALIAVAVQAFEAAASAVQALQ